MLNDLNACFDVTLSRGESRNHQGLLTAEEWQVFFREKKRSFTMQEKRLKCRIAFTTWVCAARLCQKGKYRSRTMTLLDTSGSSLISSVHKCSPEVLKEHLNVFQRSLLCANGMQQSNTRYS
eukprot:s233_g37.t1